MTEVGMSSSGCHDEPVIRQLNGAYPARLRPQPHPPGRQVDRRYVCHQHPRIGLAGEKPAQRIGDLARGQRPRRHLIQQRLEEMEVPPVQQRNLDTRPAELAHRPQASKAPADDDDPRLGG